MSLWKYMFDSDLLQRMDLEQLDRRAAMAESRLRSAHRAQSDRIEELEHELGQLALVSRALLAMLKEQGTFDVAIFNAALDKIDAEDGVIDGRVTPEAERPRKPAPVDPIVAPTPRRRV